MKKNVSTVLVLIMLIVGLGILSCSESNTISSGSAPSTFKKVLDISNAERLETLIEAPDGSIVAGGTITVIRGDSIDGPDPRSAWDGFLAKFSPAGDTLWTTHFGSYQLSHSVWALERAWDGGYIAVGRVGWPAPGTGNFAQRVFEHGELDWSMASNAGFSDFFSDIIQTPDGNYLATGQTSDYHSDAEMYLLKLDQSGGEIWDTSYAIVDTNLRLVKTMLLPNDDILILSEISADYSTSDMCQLMRTNQAGDSLWASKIPLNGYAGVFDVKLAPDNRMKILGATEDYSRYATMVVWTDSLGQLQETMLSQSTRAFRAVDGIFTADGGAILCGYFDPGDGHESGLLIRLDADGRKLWEKEYHDLDASIRLNAVIEYSGGGFVVCGQYFSLDHSESDFLLLKVNEQGEIAQEEPPRDL